MTPIRVSARAPLGAAASVAVRLASGVALLVAGARDAGAQRILGPGDDAFVLPRGTLRWTLGGRWGAVNERFGLDGERRPLGAALSTDMIDARVLPVRLGAEAGAFAVLLGSSARASLGSLRVEARARSQSVPLSLEVGVANRLAVSVHMPVTFTYASPLLIANPTRAPGSATLGRSARLVPADSAAARQAFTQLNAELAQLIARVDAFVAACGGAVNPSCAAGIALRNEAAQVSTAITQLYGSASRYSPLRGSAAESAIVARLVDLAARASALTGTNVQINARGVGAAAPVGRGEIASLLSGPASELALDSLSERSRVRVGDVELGVRFLVFDGFGAEPARLRARRGALRVALSGNVRVPTGEAPSMDDPFDPGTGLGAWFVDGGLHADAAIDARAWLSASLRGGTGFAAQRRTRFARGPLGLGPLSGAITDAAWTPGSFVQAELSPRYALSEFFGVSAHYAFTGRGADRLESAPDGRPIVEPGTLGIAAGTPSALPALARAASSRVQRLGLGASYSTVSAARRGRTRLPLELHLRHVETVTGRNVDRESYQQVELRVYTRLWGR